ncbi:protein kinase [Achlya hypogyna]|uniref:Protein kinase n=1 Tax=Achlya hypogyna TaxID=1202772 RepID=A0A1V9ZPG1_ACHHY|nr:protein kinase [Achlya hypogyna]
MPAACPYTDVKAGPILVADGNCAAGESPCLIDSNCKLTGASPFPSMANQFDGGVNAIGDLTNYKPTTIYVLNSTAPINLAHAVFPPTLTKIFFIKTTIDITSLKTDLPATVDTLFVTNLDGNQLTSYPKNLPPTFKRLSVLLDAPILTHHLVNDLTSIPPPTPSLDYLNLYGNKITSVVNLDFSNLIYLSLAMNPVTTISNINLSSNIAFLSVASVTHASLLHCSDCYGCKLTNFTMTDASYTALNALRPWNGDESAYKGFNMNADVVVDATACRASGGVVKYLWAGVSSSSIQTCVMPASRTNAAALAAIIGGIGGALVLLALVVFCCWKRRRAAGKQSSALSVAHETVQESNSDMYKAVDDDMDLSALRLLRLELPELSVTSTRPLAAGAYGEVWAGEYAGEHVAIKRLRDHSARNTQLFIDEILLLSRIDSPYIVKLVGASWRRLTDLECVVEFMDLGDLRSYLTRTPAEIYPWQEKYDCVMSIALGLVCLHSFDPRIVHRDLKSRNVLLDSTKGTKLTDFGTSREVENTMTNGMGTYQWMAPEIILGTHYSEAVDIYSFGVILSEMSTHAVPYASLVNPSTGHSYSQQYILTHVSMGLLKPSFDAKSPSWVQSIANECLALDPNDRPTAIQLVNMLRKTDAKRRN